MAQWKSQNKIIGRTVRQGNGVGVRHGTKKVRAGTGIMAIEPRYIQEPYSRQR